MIQIPKNYLILFSLSVFGCVSAPVLEETMESYRGLEKNIILRIFGEPNTTFVDEEGLLVLSYGERGILKHPDCIANFVISSEDLVQRWNWNGRHCQAFTEKFGKFISPPTRAK